MGEEEIELSDFFPKTEKNVEEMLRSLVEISQQVKDPYLINSFICSGKTVHSSNDLRVRRPPSGSIIVIWADSWNIPFP